MAPSNTKLSVRSQTHDSVCARKMAPIFLEAPNLWVRCRSFLFLKNGPQISGSPQLVGTLPQAFFFLRKMAPIFLEAPNLWVRCRRRLFFFFRKMAPIFLQAPNLWVRCHRRFFFSQKSATRVGVGCGLTIRDLAWLLSHLVNRTQQ